jgi:hypothetical protein
MIRHRHRVVEEHHQAIAPSSMSWNMSADSCTIVRVPLTGTISEETTLTAPSSCAVTSIAAWRSPVVRLKVALCAKRRVVLSGSLCQ